jgi:hypothetical protein
MNSKENIKSKTQTFVIMDCGDKTSTAIKSFEKHIVKTVIVLSVSGFMIMCISQCRLWCKKEI